MCFYNQKRFPCGDFAWTNFDSQCAYERRTGETCGIKLINRTDDALELSCTICAKMQVKIRRLSKEMKRLERWTGSEGNNNLAASIDRCERAIAALLQEIHQLTEERKRRRMRL